MTIPPALPSPIRFERTLLMLGFGCIGQAVLPLLTRHLDLAAGGRIVVVAADDDGRAQAETAGCTFHRRRIDAANLGPVLAQHLRGGDFLLNLSIDVASAALLAWCRDHAVDYLDTCIEPWSGHHFDARLPAAERTSYALREAALALRGPTPWRSTAVLTHGANPGLSFHFVKQALLELAAAHGMAVDAPRRRRDWAELARRLDVRTIHVAEHDSQFDAEPWRDDEFANTWSVEGFMAESWQPAEIGWGTHERELPPGARQHDSGCRSAIYLDQPGAATRVRSWSPGCGPFEGFLISLADAVAISDGLSVHDAAGRLVYRPSACYAYRPCDAASASLHALARRGGRPPSRRRLIKDTLVGGRDELGVLLLGPRIGAYWWGSRLSLDAARALAPHNSATSLQVAAGVLAALAWAIRHPSAGLVEPVDLPHDELLAWAAPYLGELGGGTLPARDLPCEIGQCLVG